MNMRILFLSSLVATTSLLQITSPLALAGRNTSERKFLNGLKSLPVNGVMQYGNVIWADARQPGGKVPSYVGSIKKRYGRMGIRCLVVEDTHRKKKYLLANLTTQMRPDNPPNVSKLDRLEKSIGLHELGVDTGPSNKPIKYLRSQIEDRSKYRARGARKIVKRSVKFENVKSSNHVTSIQRKTSTIRSITSKGFYKIGTFDGSVLTPRGRKRLFYEYSQPQLFQDSQGNNILHFGKTTGTLGCFYVEYDSKSDAMSSAQDVLHGIGGISLGLFLKLLEGLGESLKPQGAF